MPRTDAGRPGASPVGARLLPVLGVARRQSATAPAGSRPGRARPPRGRGRRTISGRIPASRAGGSRRRSDHVSGGAVARRRSPTGRPTERDGAAELHVARWRRAVARSGQRATHRLVGEHWGSASGRRQRRHSRSPRRARRLDGAANGGNRAHLWRFEGHRGRLPLLRAVERGGRADFLRGPHGRDRERRAGHRRRLHRLDWRDHGQRRGLRQLHARLRRAQFDRRSRARLPNAIELRATGRARSGARHRAGAQPGRCPGRAGQHHARVVLLRRDAGASRAGPRRPRRPRVHLSRRTGNVHLRRHTGGVRRGRGSVGESPERDGEW